MEKSNLIDLSKCPKQKPVSIYDNENKLIVKTTNDIVFLYVLKEIKINKISGCYVKFNGKRYDITSYGTVQRVDGLFTNYEKLLNSFFGLC